MYWENSGKQEVCPRISSFTESRALAATTPFSLADGVGLDSMFQAQESDYNHLTILALYHHDNMNM